MKQVRIADGTLCREGNIFSFKEKIEIARQLERLCVDIIEIPEIENPKSDILFVKTASSFIKKAVISVAAGLSEESIENAALALSGAKKSQIRIVACVSPVGMEYKMHKKAPKMLESIRECVALAKEKVQNVEFCAVDATRADKDFLFEAIKTAEQSGADGVTVCDTAAEMFPDDFAAFAQSCTEKTALPVTVCCENKNSFAVAAAALSVRGNALGVKTSVGGSGVSLRDFCIMIKNCGEKYDLSLNIRATELNRIVSSIESVISRSDSEKTIVTSFVTEEPVKLDKFVSAEEVCASVKKLGYDLLQEDLKKVYEEFLRVASKKEVGPKELDAIVASAALQVPATYKLVSYVINNGNIISSNAQITLEKEGKTMRDVCIGDGPIDAAFLAVDKILGRHFELDDFQIQSVTEGTEAMGSALVKLRADGRLYSGNGISTDIIGASIRAYLNAVNKIVYEEA